jgi:hypothetical protein
VERRYILVEIDCEEVQVSYAGPDGAFVMLKKIAEVVGGFGCDRTDLLVTTGIAGDEENGDSSKLFTVLDHGGCVELRAARRLSGTLTFASSSIPCSLYRYNEYFVAKRVCSVSKSFSLA